MSEAFSAEPRYLDAFTEGEDDEEQPKFVKQRTSNYEDTSHDEADPAFLLQMFHDKLLERSHDVEKYNSAIWERQLCNWDE